jgi:hypothetical protein
VIELIEDDRLKRESLAITANLLEILGALRSRKIARDAGLRSELQSRLQTCLDILEIPLSQNASGS